MKEGIPMPARILSVIFLLTLIITPAGHAEELTPLEEIPKLLMFDRFASYDGAIYNGDLIPDRITRGEGIVHTGHSLKRLTAVLGDDYTVVEDVQRTRAEQWAFLRNYLRKRNDSMHYYALCGLYYDRQLQGRFQVLEWQLCDLKILAYMHADGEKDTPRVYLLEVDYPYDEEAEVEYLPGEGNRLKRHGKCVLIWNVDNNRLVIEDS
jgi:hypothetical protein